MAVFVSTTYLHISSITHVFITSLSREMAVMLSTTYLHTNSITHVFIAIASRNMAGFSLYNLPSHHLHHKFVFGLPSHCFSQQTPSRCALILSRDMAVFLSASYPHIPSITSLYRVYFRIAFTASAFTLRLNFVKRYGSVSLNNIPSHHLHHKFFRVDLHIAFHCKRFHTAPYFCQEIWHCFFLQLTFTSSPLQVCLEFTFALLFTANAFALRLIFAKRNGSVSLFNTFTSPPSQICL